ncbi:MAG: hypothetical protein CL608_09280 [Anaerolineaceae bacterium]|nr:hypothetical protein [Anaerolineaceae bacterium]
MAAKLQQIKLTPKLNFKKLLKGFELVNICSHHAADKLFLLAVTAPANYRETKKGGIFAKLKVHKPQSFVIFLFDESDHKRFEIPKQTWNYHFVQPLPDNELLLVCGRSAYRGSDDYDLNAQVFDFNGVLKRSFLLGDGIEDVQTTTDGCIWTSYFDEGIFGNFGWHNTQPVGLPGLILWNKFGEKLYEFSPVGSLEHMADCYALNVTNDNEAWCYYYSQFPIVKIQNQEIKNIWETNLRGSDRFAIWENYALFRGGYEDHDQYFLYSLEESGEMKLQESFELIDENNRKLEGRYRTARGPIFHICQNHKLYQIDLRNLI